MTDDDYNYYQKYEWTVRLPPDTRSRSRKMWHKITLRSLRHLIAWKWETYRYDRS